MVAEDSVVLGAKCFDRPLRAEVEVVSPKPDHSTSHRLKGVVKEQELRGRIHVAPLPARGVPSITDFDTIDGRHDIMIAGATDHTACREFANCPWEHMPRRLTLKSIGDVALDMIGLGDRSIPEFPELAVSSGASQA